MTRLLLLAVLCALAVACGGEAPLAPAEEEPREPLPTVSESEPVAEETRGGSITARLFRRDTVDGETVVPSLEVISPSATDVAPGVTRFENTQVTIIGRDSERTVINAKVGTLDQNVETVELSDEVVVKMGTQTIATDHLIWDNEKRQATAANGVTIVDGDTGMAAESMMFSPDENMLVLKNVTGVIQLPKADAVKESRLGVWRTLAMWVVMATPVHAQAGGGEYTHVVITEENPAPEVVFRDNRLEHMTGGVEIQLRTANENADPLVLGAQSIEFGWTDDDKPELASLTLKDQVTVANADGKMWSSDAAFNVEDMQIAFTGGVEGHFEGIDNFKAERLDYSIKSGGMVMRNLTATIPFAEAEGGDADGFSSMDIRRARMVRISENRVQEMDGDVEIMLEPAGGGKRVTLNAESFGFSYGDADQRQPDVVSMRGGVRVNSPQGLIQSNEAEFNVARNRLNFRGAVRGSNDMMRGFNADSFNYDLDTEDGTLIQFRAKGVKFGADGGYDSMDVRIAPKVQMQGGRVTSMSDGVEIFLEGSDGNGPVTASADSIAIAYADASSSAPSVVDMTGEVRVSMDEINVRSDSAKFDMAAEKVVFSGNPVADLERAKGVTGSAIIYDLKTGNVSLPSGLVPEIARDDSNEAAGQP